MEKSLNQLKAIARMKAVMIPMAITVSIATLHFLITMYTPELSFTQGSWFGFRAANALKALTVVTPFAGLGIGLGGVYANSATGSIFTGLYWFLPLCNATIGYIVYRLAQVGPKKGWQYHAKVVMLLIVSAIIMTMLVRVNHTITKFPAVFFSAKAQAFYWSLMIPKCVSAIAASLAGYPLIAGWKIVQDKLENKVN